MLGETFAAGWASYLRHSPGIHLDRRRGAAVTAMSKLGGGESCLQGVGAAKLLQRTSPALEMVLPSTVSPRSSRRTLAYKSVFGAMPFTLSIFKTQNRKAHTSR